MKFQKYSLYTQYLRLSFSVSFLILLTILVVTIIDYKLFKNDKKFIYAQEAGNIVNDIGINFLFIEEFSKIIGEKIASSGRIAPEFIGEVLIKNIPLARVNKDILTFALFDFVTPQGKIIANTIEGAIKRPLLVEKHKRSWRELAPKSPWKLHISSPDKAIVSTGQNEDFAIPVGFGITGNNGKFLGTISTGISLEKLYARIKNTLRHDISFVILTDDSKLLLEKNEVKINLPNILNYAMLLKADEGLLQTEIKYNDQIYYYFKAIKNTPYIILIGENTVALHNEFNDRVVPHILQIVLIGILLFILFYNFRKKIVTPIVELSKITHEISIGYEYLKIPDYQIFEINLLSKQLKQVSKYMVELKATKEELQLIQNQLESANLDLEEKVKLRTSEVESALNAKTEFLNNMSHEIRTPIGGMSIISRELAENWDKFTEIRKIELANAVATNAERLRLLVGNLLDLAKFSNGKMLLELKKVDLNQLVSEMIMEAKSLYLQDKKINFVFDAAEHNNAIIDAERISQVLRNLFVNAIKFSPNRSNITINIIESEITYDDGLSIDALHFTITDQGMGIPEHELDVIFNPFIQSSKTKTKAGGTGLGLAICREIITAHHGEIWAENIGGARFNFLIPKFQTKEMDNHHIIHENNIEILEQTSDLPANIMMIDDEETCLLSMELILSNTNYKLIKFDNGDKALKYLQSGAKVDLILLDLMMPDIYGLNVLCEIKHHNPSIPVILQTGSSDEQEIKRAFIIGVAGYIKKPYQKKLVLAEIRKLIRVN